MTDKEVERNVRSTTVEGIQTPTERHVQGLSEKHGISFGEKSTARKTKVTLLDKFRRREAKRRGQAIEKSEEEKGERGAGRGEDPTE